MWVMSNSNDEVSRFPLDPDKREEIFIGETLNWIVNPRERTWKFPKAQPDLFPTLHGSKQNDIHTPCEQDTFLYTLN